MKHRIQFLRRRRDFITLLSGAACSSNYLYECRHFEDERQAYQAAVDETLARCTPLPLSYAFGSVIAGRPINVWFH